MALWLPLSLVFLGFLAPPPKPVPTEIVDSHRQIVCGASCDAWKSLTAVGAAEVRTLSGGRRQVSGEIKLETGKNHFDLNFRVGLPEFPGEHFSYDGKKVLVDVLMPGLRSPFGDFLYLRQQIIKEGLLGGTLNRDWPLLDHERLKKIKHRAWKKKQKLHEIEYRPSKAGSLRIRIYLDEEWNHVKTVYTFNASPHRSPIGP